MTTITTKPAPVNANTPTLGDQLAAILDRHDAREAAAGRPTTRGLAEASLAELDAAEDGTDYGRPDVPDAEAEAWWSGWQTGEAMIPATAPRGYSDEQRRAWEHGYNSGHRQAADEAAAEVAWLCEAFSVPAEYAPGEFGGWGGHDLD